QLPATAPAPPAASHVAPAPAATPRPLETPPATKARVPRAAYSTPAKVCSGSSAIDPIVTAGATMLPTAVPPAMRLTSRVARLTDPPAATSVSIARDIVDCSPACAADPPAPPTPLNPTFVPNRSQSADVISPPC